MNNCRMSPVEIVQSILDSLIRQKSNISRSTELLIDELYKRVIEEENKIKDNPIKEHDNITININTLF